MPTRHAKPSQLKKEEEDVLQKILRSRGKLNLHYKGFTELDGRTFIDLEAF